MAIQKLCVYLISLALALALLQWFGGTRITGSLSVLTNSIPDIDNVYRGLTYRQGGEGVYGVFPMAAVQSAKIDFFGVTEVTRVNKSIGKYKVAQG
jgi:hypothetical protein